MTHLNLYLQLLLSHAYDPVRTFIPELDCFHNTERTLNGHWIDDGWTLDGRFIDVVRTCWRVVSGSKVHVVTTSSAILSFRTCCRSELRGLFARHYPNFIMFRNTYRWALKHVQMIRVTIL